MATEKINNKYIQTDPKEDGKDTLEASEWNAISAAVATSHTKINDIIDDLSEIPSSGGGSASYEDVTEQGGDLKIEVKLDTGITNLFGDTSVGSAFEFTKKTKNNGDYKGTNLTICGNNNINIEPRESVGETKGGNISLKPGDDIELCSHHRTTNNQEEVSVKVINGSDKPTELKINTSEITLTTKDKTGDKPNVLDVNIESAKNTMGYLKVRAQAIDLRCEDHGGIALQPKGEDSDHFENKIKFEHGGGDGLEFGTFNTKHTSIFTDDYRFNKDGVIKLATRKKVLSDKYITLLYQESQPDTLADYTFDGTENGNVYNSHKPSLDVGNKYSVEEVIKLFGFNNIIFSNKIDNEISEGRLQNNSIISILIYDDGTEQEVDTCIFKVIILGDDDDNVKYKYFKNSTDDFYDFVNNSDPTCTWEDLITLVNYFKSGSGQANGPWANN